jgi:hypothetical protein
MKGGLLILKSVAIKKILEAKTHPDLACLYNLGMECQVNVAQDGGERVDGEFRGRKWHGFSDGLTTWKSFRIPYKAYSEPEFTDVPLKFDLESHVEAIGMTGWDWQKKVSRWFAYDFDALVGHSVKHSKKLTNEQLQEVVAAARKIEWVTIRKSTSGKGIHLYVFCDNFRTSNHHEHAACGRAVLGQLSALTGFSFVSKVDICGGNMWVWHRKMVGTDGLELIKKGSILTKEPPNWRDHIQVVKGTRRKNLPQVIEDGGSADIFEDLTSQRPRIPLDEEHKKLIEFLRNTNALWWWDQDHHMLITHTIHLKEAHEELNLRGYFETISTGKERGVDHNCFLYPLRKGAWAVRRYSPGVAEHDSWDQDGQGWTRCYFNKEADLRVAAKAFGGLEDTKGGFVFREAEVAARAAQLLGVNIEVANALRSRETTLAQHKDGRLVVTVKRETSDPPVEMQGWLAQGNKPWTKIYNAQVGTPGETDTGNFDDIIRHLVTVGNEDCGWVIKSDSSWHLEPLHHVKAALGSMGFSGKEITNIVGTSIMRCWKIVNKPFQPEYPGDREWNRNAAQFRFVPSTEDTLTYPTWSKIMNHVGRGLDEAVLSDPWCKANGLKTGADYLKCWIASLFQEPTEPLPYLFFYSHQQNTGKSMFHEALKLLLTRGYQRANAALTNPTGFNAELEGVILCIVEEIDLRKNAQAYNRIKDWVTSLDFLVHPKNKTPYLMPNTSHWIQCSNNHQACPIFPGDSRIVMAYVEPLNLTEMIPKKEIAIRLEKEAPDFLAEVLRVDVPRSNDRLNIPVIMTEDKRMVERTNQSLLDDFIEETCKPAEGYWIKFSEFYSKFLAFLDVMEHKSWSKIRVGKELPIQHPKGRDHGTGQFYIGNLAFKATDTTEKKPLLVKDGDYLECQK